MYNISIDKNERNILQLLRPLVYLRKQYARYMVIHIQMLQFKVRGRP